MSYELQLDSVDPSQESASNILRQAIERRVHHDLHGGEMT